MHKSPPMGWNSWDCYGASVCEDEVRANAEYMARNLKQYGWEYIIVDIQWYEPTAESNEYHDGAKLVMDEYSRLMPAENRFPSAANGEGFHPLADYVHSLGLKFGIHILRGIPKQAVFERTKILNSEACAADIADVSSICEWNGDMYGVNTDKDDAQQYYNSLIDLYCSWGVDFLKVDDIARPYREKEIELIKNAIDSCGRDIMLSLSPGDAPVNKARHIRRHADMWRMTDDFWDDWEQLKKMFDYCRDWSDYTGSGHWADADMLPLGRIGIRSRGGGRMTGVTKNEQITIMTLWSIFRSPMFFGGDMTYNDEWTLSLMRNKEIIYILKHSHDAHELYRKKNEIVWVCESENKNIKYAAQFNIGNVDIEIYTGFEEIGARDVLSAREIWTNIYSGADDGVSAMIGPHGAAIWKIECGKN